MRDIARRVRPVAGGVLGWVLLVEWREKGWSEIFGRGDVKIVTRDVDSLFFPCSDSGSGLNDMAQSASGFGSGHHDDRQSVFVPYPIPIYQMNTDILRHLLAAHLYINLNYCKRKNTIIS